MVRGAILFFLILSTAVATEPRLRQMSLDELMKPLEARRPSPAQYDAFRNLVNEGPDGWAILFLALCDINETGNTTRCIDSFFENSGIPQDVLDRFQRARNAELAKRAANESWALLYAQAYTRSLYPIRGDTNVRRLDRRFDAIGKQIEHPEKALLDVAFVRVMLVDDADFPGHRFPWAGTEAQQTAAIHKLLDWWESHREHYANAEQ